MSKKDKALAACNKVINGIEDETISTSSALLQCIKIARLMSDEDAVEWLSYEYSGYPVSTKGLIVSRAFKAGTTHGRGTLDNSKRSIFTDTCSELEGIIESAEKSINNFSLSGISIDGQYALTATDKLLNSTIGSISSLRSDIVGCKRRLSILKGQYYNFALKWYIQLQFSNAAQSVFEDYQQRVDNAFSKLSNPTLRKLQAILDQLQDDDNPERYNQVLTSCRRLWEATANELFEKYYPNYGQNTYKTVSGKEIDISGDHFNNRMSAVIEHVQAKSAKNTLVGSEITYLLDWMNNIYSRQNTGVHAEVSKNDAEQCIIQTYIFLGDLIELTEFQEVNSKVSANES